MKYLLALVSCILLISCGNELDLIEEGNDIPVIYGLLSSIDTAQYIRVEKAFADELISAVDLAKDPSQLYYNNPRVALIHEASGAEYIFEEVDGTAEGYPRDEGAFASIPNTLYKKRSSEMNLVEGDTYRLEVLRDDIDTPVTASTVLTIAPRIVKPGLTGLLDLVPNSQTIIQWRGNETIALYDLALKIKFFEKDENIPGSLFQERQLMWNLTQGLVVVPDVANVEHAFDGISFYSFMAGQLEAGDNWRRNLSNVDIVLLGGGEEIQDYRSVGLANLGITSSQDIPTYTNLSEGKGIFSSVTRVIKEDVQLTSRSIDSLKTNIITRNLGF